MPRLYLRRAGRGGLPWRRADRSYCPLRRTGRHDHLVRPHENPMRADLSPANARHADDFVLGFEVHKFRKRLCGSLTSDDVHASFHQQLNGGCAGPSQPFARKRERTLVAVSLRDNEVMSPVLLLGLPLEAIAMRPSDGVNAIFGNAQPSTGEQRGQSTAAAVVSRLDEGSFRRGTAATAVLLDVRPRHVVAHVCAVFRVLLETRLKIALHHPLKLRAREFLLEFGCADGALRKHGL